MGKTGISHKKAIPVSLWRVSGIMTAPMCGSSSVEWEQKQQDNRVANELASAVRCYELNRCTTHHSHTNLPCWFLNAKIWFYDFRFEIKWLCSYGFLLSSHLHFFCAALVITHYSWFSTDYSTWMLSKQNIQTHHFMGLHLLNGVSAFWPIVKNFLTFIVFYYVNFCTSLYWNGCIFCHHANEQYAREWTTKRTDFFFVQSRYYKSYIPENYGLIMNEIDPIKFPEKKNDLNIIMKYHLSRYEQ